MFDKVIVFGDSHMAGTELYQETIPNFNELVLDEFPDVKLGYNGSVIAEPSTFSDIRKRVRKLALQTAQGAHGTTDVELDKMLSCGAKLAEHYGVPYYNYADGVKETE